MAPLRAVIPVLLMLQVTLGGLAAGRTICIGACSPMGVELVAESCESASDCCGADEAGVRAGDDANTDAGHAEHGACAASGECGDCRDIEVSMDLFRAENRRGMDDPAFGIEIRVPTMIMAIAGDEAQLARIEPGLAWRTGPPGRAPLISTVILRL